MQWLAANPGAVASDKVSNAAADKVMYAERALRVRVKVTFDAPVEELSFGSFIERTGVAYLVTDTVLLKGSG